MREGLGHDLTRAVEGAMNFGRPSDPTPPKGPVRRYPLQPFEPVAGPTVSFKVMAIDGEEGRELRAAQARAIKDLLIWVHTERRRRRTEGEPS